MESPYCTPYNKDEQSLEPNWWTINDVEEISCKFQMHYNTY